MNLCGRIRYSCGMIGLLLVGLLVTFGAFFLIALNCDFTTTLSGFLVTLFAGCIFLAFLAFATILASLIALFCLCGCTGLAVYILVFLTLFTSCAFAKLIAANIRTALINTFFILPYTLNDSTVAKIMNILNEW